MKYFCLDVSGSMSTEHLQMAIEQIALRRAPGDVLFMFDCEEYGPWPVEDVLGRMSDPEDMVKSLCPPERGRGGSDARPVLKAIEAHQKTHGVTDSTKILVSDGLISPDEFKLFDVFIEVK